jgi:hypothetical protein
LPAGGQITDNSHKGIQMMNVNSSPDGLASYADLSDMPERDCGRHVFRGGFYFAEFVPQPGEHVWGLCCV